VSQCAGIWLGGADHEKRIMCLLLPQEPIVRACPLWVISGHFSVPASCGHSVACAFRHSLDHLVGASKQCGRDGETERLRGLEVEDKFEFGRLHNRKVGRFLTLEDAASARFVCTRRGDLFRSWPGRPKRQTNAPDRLLGPRSGPPARPVDHGRRQRRHWSQQEAL
jgi:hypothetical protein